MTDENYTNADQLPARSSLHLDQLDDEYEAPIINENLRKVGDQPDTPRHTTFGEAHPQLDDKDCIPEAQLQRAIFNVKETKELTADRKYTEALPLTMDLANILEWCKSCKYLQPNPWRQPAFVNEFSEHDEKITDSLFERIGSDSDIQEKARLHAKRKLNEEQIKLEHDKLYAMFGDMQNSHEVKFSKKELKELFRLEGESTHDSVKKKNQDISKYIDHMFREAERSQTYDQMNIIDGKVSREWFRDYLRELRADNVGFDRRKSRQTMKKRKAHESYVLFPSMVKQNLDDIENNHSRARTGLLTQTRESRFRSITGQNGTKAQDKQFLKICDDKRSLYEWCEQQKNNLDRIEEDDEDRKKNNLLIQHGSGIRCYFELLEMLLKQQFMISAVACLMMFFFVSKTGWIGTLDDNFFLAASYGNMGFSKQICVNEYLETSVDPVLHLNVECEPTTQIKVANYTGIFSMTDDSAYILRYCQYPDEQYERSQVQELFDTSALETKINQECQGKQSCQSDINLSDYFGTQILSSSVLFTQVTCGNSADIKEVNTRIGFWQSFFVFLIAAVFTRGLKTIQASCKAENFLAQDQLVNPGDYGIMFKIKNELYDCYRMDINHKLVKSEGKITGIDKRPALIQYFLSHIKTSIKSTIDKYCRDNPPTSDMQKFRSIEHKVKHISFAFDNQEILNLLTKRGTALKNANFDKAIEHEKEIDRLYHDPEKQEQFKRPTKVFVIFEEARSAELMHKFIKKMTLVKNETPVNVKKACNPDMMIWETISKRDENKTRKMIGRYSGWAFMAAITLSAFYGYQYFQRGIFEIRYMAQPPMIDCENFNTLNPETQKTLATFEFDHNFYDNYVAEEHIFDEYMSARVSKKGWLSCFCHQKVVDDRKNYEKTLYESSEHPGQYICETWRHWTQTSFQSMISNQYSTIIVLINFLLRLGFVTFVEKFMEFSDISEKQRYINNRIWFLLFLQLGVMLVFASWNSREVSSTRWFGGIYTDFNRFWFKDVGQFFVNTMVKNAFWPFIEYFLLQALVQYIRIAIDQNKWIWPNDVTRSRKKTISQFEETYMGPEFEGHWKFSYITYVIFVTFLWGSVLPIMFPIGLLNIFIFWAAERLSMFFIFRKPPLYTDYLTTTTINTMYSAVVLYLLVACWAYSNPNLFLPNYEVQPADPEYLWPLNNHYFSQFITKITPATPLLIAFFASIYGNINVCLGKTEKLSRFLKQKQLNKLMQDLSQISPVRLPYSQVLKEDQKTLIDLEEDTAANLYLYKKDHSRFMEDSDCEDTIQSSTQIQETPRGDQKFEFLDLNTQELKKQNQVKKDQTMHSTFNYDILQNKKYQKMFAYEPLGQQREYLIAVQQHIRDPNEPNKFIVDQSNEAKDAPIYKIDDDHTLVAAHYQSNYVRYIIDLPFMHDQNFNDVEEHTTLGLINFIIKKKQSGSPGIHGASRVQDAGDLGVQRKSYDMVTVRKRLNEEIVRKMNFKKDYSNRSLLELPRKGEVESESEESSKEEPAKKDVEQKEQESSRVKTEQLQEQVEQSQEQIQEAQEDQQNQSKTLVNEKSKVKDEVIVKSIHSMAELDLVVDKDPRNSYPIGSDLFQKMFPLGEQEVQLLITVTQFKPEGLSDGRFQLVAQRKLNRAICIEGENFNAQPDQFLEGSVIMKMKIYFHDDGMPNQKKVKLELYDDGKEVAHARFNIGVFYNGEPKQIQFSNEKGTCVLQVKLINKNSYNLIDKISQGINNQVQLKQDTHIESENFSFATHTDQELALRGYESYHNLPEGSATFQQVEQSSIGFQGFFEHYQKSQTKQVSEQDKSTSNIKDQD